MAGLRPREPPDDDPGHSPAGGGRPQGGRTRALGRGPLTQELSADEARRIALGAQGFGNPAPARPDVRHLRRLARRLHAIQIDSVNVLERAHYLPAYSRLGPYPRRSLDRLAYERRELFEYWGHRASLLPVELHPLLRWRMEGYRARLWWREGDEEAERYVEDVLAQVAERGPIAASELSDPGERRGPWWGWSSGKAALEWLFASGRIAVAGRRNFERLYDLTERVLPREVLDAPTVPPDEAKRELLLRAAAAFGVATARDLGDYFHVDASYERPMNGSKRAPSRLRELVDGLVEDERLVPVRVEGWKEGAYLHPSASAPSGIDARALVSPFDPLVWERSRTSRLFGFDYKIEIYIPKAKRRYGYYVLPFLLGDRLVARVDLKADRKAGVLRVPGAFAESGVDVGRVASELGAELRRMADWLELEDVRIGRKGDLATRLRRAIT